jgi:UPF0716 family protein affecting phage T7 exclusion
MSVPGPGGSHQHARRSVGRTLTTVAVGILLVPVVEIAVAVAVARGIGGGLTVLLVLLGSVLGLVLLRREGAGALRDVRDRRPGSLAPAAAGDRALRVVAALLLVFPGLLTDAVGLLLLLPPVRVAVGAVLARRLRQRFDVARRRVTVRGEVVEGVTVTTWVDDAPRPAVEPPAGPSPNPTTGPGDGPAPRA